MYSMSPIHDKHEHRAKRPHSIITKKANPFIGLSFMLVTIESQMQNTQSSPLPTLQQ